MPLILASASPVRATLLRNAGIDVTTTPPRVDEDAIREGMEAAGASPRDIADRLAEAKALKVSGRHPGALVLGCDQVLAFDGRVITKSKGRDDARALLSELRGQRHQLLSAAVIAQDGQPLWRFVGVVRLAVRPFSDAFLDAYLDRNWPSVAGAVGAYHLEGEGARLFSRIEGDYFTVLGLPLIELLSYLTDIGELQA